MTTPAYRKIADALRRRITNGKYPPGSLLPTEHELCAAFDISRHTARDALRILTDEGLIERRRGAGSIVSAIARGGFTQSLTSLEDLLQYARDAKLQILGLTPVKRHTAEMSALTLDPRVHWTRIDGFRGDATRPIALTTIYVRSALCPPANEIESWPGALNELIAQGSGVRTARIDQRINAVTLSPSEARRLCEADGAAALRTVRLYLDSKGDVFQASMSLHPGERFTYAMTLESGPTKPRGS
jgi:DNA-binding GntR family transcriptional regulator